MADPYTKAVLTIIALCLVALVVERAPSQAVAQAERMRVVIVDEKGRSAAFGSHVVSDSEGNLHPILLTEVAETK